MWLSAVLVVSTLGCASSSSKWVALRSTPRNPLSDSLGLLTRQGPKPTARTLQLLRRYDLDANLSDRRALLTQLGEIDRSEPHREHLYALAELAYVGAKRAERSKQQREALELYGAAVVYSYQYLFDERYPSTSNPYDPQFRQACEVYNAALEGTLRTVQRQRPLRPGESRPIQTARHDCRLNIELHSDGWHNEDFDHVEFVTDYEVHGLRNHYHSFGLGVPLIAVRRQHDDHDVREQFYPPQLSFPVTAFLRIRGTPAGPRMPVQLTSGQTRGLDVAAPALSETVTGEHLDVVLELHDPLVRSSVEVAGRRVPMETDLSTPLAHTLSQEALDDTKLSTTGLLKPDKVKQLSGLYMLEPFHEDKIPVLMVHGLWSSPVTWMEMFNDLRSDPYIRKYYQFWFYLYPSGQPFWSSAAQLRRDLVHMRTSLDPQRKLPALDQTVLVGHSMGGLVSKLQTVDSGNEFWSTLSDRPFSELQADPEIRQQLADTYFFAPNASIRRVVTIGTPHRGSEFANDATQWLGRKLIRIPSQMLLGRNQLIARNPDFFRPGAPLDISTSIDSLSPKSPLLPVLLEADAGPWVRYHNIIGRAPDRGVKNKLSQWIAGEGDGVVSLASARLEEAESEVVVPTDHVSVHRHPQSILEVRRILRQHLEDLRAGPAGGVRHAARPAELLLH
jgi:triacylglycerol esterase/lipase EstA (alpha/beta hydrolase family)